VTSVATKRVVVTNRVFAETRALLAAHAELDVNTSDEPWSTTEVMARCQTASAVMAFMTDHIDAGFFDACPQLQIVGAALKGYDNIDVDAATRAGVWVTVVPDLLTVPTAELAIGLMLALGRHITTADREIRAHGFHGWRPRHYGIGLDGTTVGIVGMGRVGQAIAQRLAGFSCTLLGYDQATVPLADLPAGVELVALDALLARSDWVVLALPLTVETQHVLDAAAIRRMQPGALLVNPARGSLVDEAAVADAIAAGHLAGYAADVFECEDWARADRPRQIDPRLTAVGAPTVLTPHIGSAVVAARRAIEASAATSIIEALSGQTPSGALRTPAVIRGAGCR
jgi:phosphonate dehydrogenase